MKKHGNTGNKNSAKDPGEVKSSQIQIRCTQQQKSAIVRQLKDNEKLSDFMLEAAREKIEQRAKK